MASKAAHMPVEIVVLKPLILNLIDILEAGELPTVLGKIEGLTYLGPSVKDSRSNLDTLLRLPKVVPTETPIR